MGYYDAERLTLRRPWSLPALPEALGALCEQVETEGFSASKAAEVIRLEPSLLVQTLRSASLALPPGAPIDDHLAAAVAELGGAGVELLVRTILARHLDAYLNARASSELNRRWRRSLGTALCAKHLAARVDPALSELGYFCGLLSGLDHLSAVPALQPIVEIMAYAERPVAELEQALPLVRVISVAGNLSLDQADFDGAFVSGLLARHAGLSADALEQARAAASGELTHLCARFAPRPGRDQGGEHSLLPASVIGFLSSRLQSAKSLMAVAVERHQASPSWPWLAQLLWARHEITPIAVWRVSQDAQPALLSCCFTNVSPERAALLQRLPASDAHAPGRAWLGHGAQCLGVHARAEATLADQQLLDLCGTAGLMCLSFGSAHDRHVLMGGLPHAVVGADQDALSARARELADALLASTAAPRQTPPSQAASGVVRDPLAGPPRGLSEGADAAANPAPLGGPERSMTSAHATPDSDLDRLLLRKTVHEIRTPLSVMKTYLSLLKQKIPESDAARSELGILGEEIDRVSGLLRQLTDSTRDEPRQWVSVNQLVTDMLSLIGKQHPSAAPVQIRTDLDPDLPAIFSLRDRIKQVLLNLVKNALEAQPDGGAVEVITRAGAGAPAADSIRLTVRDRGPGLPAAIKARLFEPFNSTKADPSVAATSRDAGGSDTGVARGLGLHIVRTAVAMLGGRIQVASRSGEGTEFIVDLPVAAAAPAAETRAAPLNAGSPGSGGEQSGDRAAGMRDDQHGLRTGQTQAQPSAGSPIGSLLSAG